MGEKNRMGNGIDRNELEVDVIEGDEGVEGVEGNDTSEGGRANTCSWQLGR